MPSLFASIPFLPSYGSTAIDAALYCGGALVVALLAAYAYLWTYREWAIPYKNLPGPKPGHWFMGNIGQIIPVEPGVMHDKWSKEHGLTFRYRMLFGAPRVCSADPVTLNYILSHHDMFPKPALTRKFLTDLLGDGVLVAEGTTHRRQRRILNPSFSPQSIRDVVPVFYDKAEELREKLLGLIEEDALNIAAPTPASKEDAISGGRKIDVMKFLGQCTIDVIGVAGFNYDFKALSQPKNELADAFTKMFSAGQSITFMSILQAFVPGASKIPTERQRTVWASKATTQRIGRRLIQEKKWAITQAHTGGLEKGDIVGKDLLSSCIRANMAADLKPEHKLSDDEVLAQITTFMLAGNETSSTALTWILYMLSLHPDVQARLRKECLASAEERPSMEEISAMPYLGAVVHEGLRLLSPVSGTIREAAEDVVLPLGAPVKGRDGQMMDHVKLSKGAQLFLPISVINTSETIWGADAKSFNPSRHLSEAEGGSSDKLRAEQNAVQGTWGNLLTFLGGTRNCIGYRFAVVEIKVILFVLMRGLEFEELASKPKIEKKSSIVMRPRVIGEEAAGLQMPLMVKPLAQA